MINYYYTDQVSGKKDVERRKLADTNLKVNKIILIELFI